MTNLRVFISVAVLVLLAAGYLASQYFYFTGRASAWAQLVDTPAIAALALMIFLGAIAAALVRPKEKE